MAGGWQNETFGGDGYIDYLDCGGFHSYMDMFKPIQL